MSNLWKEIFTVVCIIVRRLACLWSKMPVFQWSGIKEGVEPLSLAFKYLILMIWRPCDLNLVMISSLASKCQDFKFGRPVFQPFYEMKLKTSKFKLLAFWSQWKYHDQIQIIRINIEILVGVAPPLPTFPPTGTQAFYFINRPNGGLLCTGLYISGPSTKLYIPSVIETQMNLEPFVFGQIEPYWADWIIFGILIKYKHIFYTTWDVWLWPSPILNLSVILLSDKTNQKRTSYFTKMSLDQVHMYSFFRYVLVEGE